MNALPDSPLTAPPQSTSPQRAKKRRWKAACASADGEIASLHGRLLARQQDIEALERRVENLEAELLLLGASARVQVAVGTGGEEGGGGEGADALAALAPVDVPEARRLLNAAMEGGEARRCSASATRCLRHCRTAAPLPR